MAIKNTKELFVLMLSDVRQATERATKIFQEITPIVQNQDIKELVEAHLFVEKNILGRIDECFKLIGEQPAKLSGRLHEVFVEDFRKELGEIQSAEAKHLFVLSKAIHLVHLRMGEYVAMIAASDMTGHFGIGVLLESCLADKLAFVDRTRRLIRTIVETKVESKLAA